VDGLLTDFFRITYILPLLFFPSPIGPGDPGLEGVRVVVVVVVLLTLCFPFPLLPPPPALLLA